MDKDETPPEDSELTKTTGDPSPTSPAQRPRTIGQYRILGKLGEGGMGMVYEAQQEHPKRKVAVKIVRGGQFVDEQRVRMFQREADTLARLKHANIAAIYESGRTEDGQHFFAMELVRGETLEAYLKERPQPFTPQELELRLRLFRKIADAVHYAHQRGVIHRDLKPSNIVVTEEAVREDASTVSGLHLPEIKILDFGLARITEGDVAATTMATDVGVIKGTLPYMSPEQARGDPEEIDVRTDVYALGVLLYELLTGTRPYDVLRKSLAEAVRVICEDPPRPLKQTWSGVRRPDHDIETILGKALEKTADRRYASAAALSEDIGRYLTSQPILARPPSTMYQLRKFAARNRALVVGVVATFVVLVAGIVVSTIFGIGEARQRRAAEQAQADLEVVVEFQSGMLSDLDPGSVGQRMLTDLRERVADMGENRGASEDEVEARLASFDSSVRGVNMTDAALRMFDEEILGRAAAEIDKRFEEQPLIDARLRNSIGYTYRELGLYERAAPHLESALATRKRLLGREDPDTLATINEMGYLLHMQGKLDEAEPYHREALEGNRRVLGNDDPSTLDSVHTMGLLLEGQGKLDEAEPYYREAVEGFRRVLGDDDRWTLIAINALGNLLLTQNQLDEAEPYLREALEGRRRVLGDDHPDTLQSINNMAYVLHVQGKLDEAELFYREALEGCRRVMGDDHDRTLMSINNMGYLLQSQGKLAEAEPYYREALEGFRRVLGYDHPQTLIAVNNMGFFLQAQGRLDETEPYFREALEKRRRLLGNDHPDTLFSINNMGYLLRRQGKLDEAEPYHREVIERSRRVMGDDHPNTLTSISNMGILLYNQGKLDEAEAYFREALEGRRRVLGSDHRDTLDVLFTNARLSALLGDREEALDFLHEAVQGGYVRKGLLDNPDLASLRGDPEFEAIAAELEKRIGEE